MKFQAVRPRKEAPAIQLFPFMDVFLCIMGALIIMFMASVRNSHDKVFGPPSPELAQDLEEVQVDREMVEWKVAQLRTSRDKTAADLTEQRAEFSHIEEHTARLREELTESEKVAAQLTHEAQDGDPELGKLRAQFAQSQFDLLAAKNELDKASKDARRRRDSFAIIPYDGPNGTRRRPIYVECREDGIFLQPEGIRFTEDDFVGELGPSNPLAAALRAAREYLVRNRVSNPGDDGEPYPLLLVRPDGVVAYYKAREAMHSWAAEFGYELIEQDWKIDYRPPDPSLSLALQKAVGEARHRQITLALAAPRLLSAEDRDRLRDTLKAETARMQQVAAASAAASQAGAPSGVPGGMPGGMPGGVPGGAPGGVPGRPPGFASGSGSRSGNGAGLGRGSGGGNSSVAGPGGTALASGNGPGGSGPGNGNGLGSRYGNGYGSGNGNGFGPGNGNGLGNGNGPGNGIGPGTGNGPGLPGAGNGPGGTGAAAGLAGPGGTGPNGTPGLPGYGLAANGNGSRYGNGTGFGNGTGTGAANDSSLANGTGFGNGPGTGNGRTGLGSGDGTGSDPNGLAGGLGPGGLGQPVTGQTAGLGANGIGGSPGGGYGGVGGSGYNPGGVPGGGLGSGPLANGSAGGGIGPASAGAALPTGYPGNGVGGMGASSATGSANGGVAGVGGAYGAGGQGGNGAGGQASNGTAGQGGNGAAGQGANGSAVPGQQDLAGGPMLNQPSSAESWGYAGTGGTTGGGQGGQAATGQSGSAGGGQAGNPAGGGQGGSPGSGPAGSQGGSSASGQGSGPTSAGTGGSAGSTGSSSSGGPPSGGSNNQFGNSNSSAGGTAGPNIPFLSSMGQQQTGMQTMTVGDPQSNDSSDNQKRRSQVASPGAVAGPPNDTVSNANLKPFDRAGQSFASTTGNQRPIGDYSSTSDSSNDDTSTFSRRQPKRANRGKNWGVSDKSGQAVAITRPIRLQCYPDRLIVVSDTGNASDSKTIMLTQPMHDAVDELVSAIGKRTDSWGLAGRGMYWRPSLTVDVTPGAEARYKDLYDILNDSGLEIKASQAAQAQQTDGTNRR